MFWNLYSQVKLIKSIKESYHCCQPLIITEILITLPICSQKNYARMFALLIHIYYEDSWEQFLRTIVQGTVPFNPVIMVNLCNTSVHTDKIVGLIKADFPSAYIIRSPNKGKDIGGKLALIDLFLKTNQSCDYMVMLHDKLSPHAVTGDTWRTKLLSIVDPKKIKTILKGFRDKSATGIIGAKDFIRNEYNHKLGELETTNKMKLTELIKKYNLRVNNYLFIAGTMFWIRSGIIKDFFTYHKPLECREMLEEGDFTDQFEGTYTHSWERLFCLLATSEKYNIEGI